MSQARDQEILDALNRGPPREPARIDRMVEKLRRLWHEWPDHRLGQLVESSSYRAQLLQGPPPVSLFYFEDDKMEAALDRELVMAGLEPEKP